MPRGSSVLARLQVFVLKASSHHHSKRVCGQKMTRSQQTTNSIALQAINSHEVKKTFERRLQEERQDHEAKLNEKNEQIQSLHDELNVVKSTLQQAGAKVISRKKSQNHHGIPQGLSFVTFSV